MSKKGNDNILNQMMSGYLVNEIGFKSNHVYNNFHWLRSPMGGMYKKHNIVGLATRSVSRKFQDLRYSSRIQNL